MRRINTILFSKILLIFTVILLISFSAASVEFESPNDGDLFNKSFDLELEPDSFSIDDAEVEYKYGQQNDTIATGITSDDSSTYRYEDWEPHDNEDYSEYRVWAVASNETEEKASTINISYDTIDPALTLNEVKAHGNGNVEFDVDTDRNDGSDIEGIQVYRNDSLVSEDKETGTNWNISETEYEAFEYELRLFDDAGNFDVKISNVIHIEDNEAPKVDNKKPGELINEEEPDTGITVDDDVSGVESVNLTLWEEDKEEMIKYEDVSSIGGEDTYGVDFTPDNELNEGEYVVNATFEDVAGNWGTEEWSFEVDITPPDTSTDLIPDPNDDLYRTTDTSIVIEVGDSSDIYYAECYVGDPDGTGDKFGEHENPEEDEIDCGTLDPSDYTDGSQSVYIYVEDEAGNDDSWKVGEYVFDTQPPTIDSLEVHPEYTNEAPNVTVEAFDIGSGLGDLEYSFQSFDGGNGEEAGSMEGEEDEIVFQPDMEDKEEDDYDIYVRVQDNTDKWSDQETIEFTYDPTAEPSATFEYETLEVEENSITDYNVTVINEGKVPMVSSILEFEGVIEGSSDEFVIMGEEESNIEFEVETDQTFGTYEEELTLTSSIVEETATVEVNVLASDDTVSEVDSLVSDKQEELGDLENELDDLRNEGAGDEMLENAESSIETFRTSLAQVEEASENNTYHIVSSEIENLDSLSTSASQEIQEAEEEYNSYIFRRNLFAGFGVFFLLIGGLGAFFYRSEEYGFDIDKIHDSDISIDSLEGLKSRISTIFEDKEEAEEFEWEGFN